MAGLMDIGGGNDPLALYAGLLSPQQLAGARQQGLYGALAGLASVPYASRLPIGMGQTLAAAGAGMGQAEQNAVTNYAKSRNELLQGNLLQMQGPLMSALYQGAMTPSPPHRGSGQLSAPAAGDGSSPGPAAGGSPPSPTDQASAGGSNWEVAHNNFAGMRMPGVPAAGGPLTNPAGWQQFATPEDGIAAISHQLDRYASGATTGKPLTTLRQIVSTWAPASDNNDTGGLISRASKIVGVGPDDPLNLGDPTTKAKLVEAMIRGEQGGKLPVDPATITRVVSNPNTSALTMGGSAAPVPSGIPAAPAGLPPQAAGAGQSPGGINPDYIAWAQQQARIYTLLGKPVPPDIAAAATLEFAGPKAAAEAAAKLPYTPINIRQGGSAWIIGPDGRPRLIAQSPKLPVAAQLGPNGEAIEVPGGLSAIQNAATAQAAGPAAFKPEEVPGPYGRENLTTRLNFALGLGGGNGAPAVTQSAPGTPGLGIGGALPAAMSPVAPTPPSGAPTTVTPAAGNGGAPAPSGAPARSPEAAGPLYPVRTPFGVKDLSALTTNDLFPGGIGIPRPPAPPPGMTYGKPSETEEQIQKDDATRVEEYGKQASGNQKIYQDLSHLRDVLQAGVTTGKLAPLWADIGNIAQSLGMKPPEVLNPNDPAVFQKAATDLVFAAVKKLAGQVKVAEIEGYKQANPGMTIPTAANLNIINDILANGKWEDARARLASEYVTQTGGAPLAAFDAKFNQMVPLVDVTAAYKNAIRQTPAYQAALKTGAPAVFPEDARPKAAAPEQPMPTGATDKRVMGGTTYFRIGGTWYH